VIASFLSSVIVKDWCLNVHLKKLEIHNVSAKKKYERVKKNHIAHLNTTITIHTFTTSCFIIIIQFSPNFAPLIVNASATKKTEIVFSRIDSC